MSPDFVETTGMGTIKSIRKIQSQNDDGKSNGIEIQVEFYIGNSKYPQTERLTMWDDHAKRMEDAQPGMRVYFKGRPKLRSWEDKKTGEKKYMNYVEIDKHMGRIELIYDQTMEQTQGDNENNGDW